MANERINLNGMDYISIDYLIDRLVAACLRYHYEGKLGTGEAENQELDFVEYLLTVDYDGREAYDAFVRSYVHQKYPQVFGKEKES